MARVTRSPGPDRRSLLEAMRVVGSQSGQVGWFESARYEKGQPVAGVAFVQEKGSAKMGIPARPYFQPTADRQREAWARIVGQVSKAAIQGKTPPGSIMELLCLRAEGDVRMTITKVTTPALSERTIKARKRRLAPGSKVVAVAGVLGIAKPLVDTAIMLNTLTSRIK